MRSGGEEEEEKRCDRSPISKIARGDRGLAAAQFRRRIALFFPSCLCLATKDRPPKDLFSQINGGVSRLASLLRTGSESLLGEDGRKKERTDQGRRREREREIIYRLGDG